MARKIIIKGKRKAKLDANAYLRALLAFAREIDEERLKQRAAPEEDRDA